MVELHEHTEVAGSVPVADPDAARRDRLSRFTGSADNAIDDKGRLTIPLSMRKPLLGGARLAMLDGNAVIWDVEGFKDLNVHLYGLVGLGELDARFLRNFNSRVQSIVPDGQGRIVISHDIRIEAGLERDVRIKGVGPRIELVALGTVDLDELAEIDDSIVTAIDLASF